MHRELNQDQNTLSSNIYSKISLYLFLYSFNWLISTPSAAQTVVPTFNSLGIYWQVEKDTIALDSCKLYYKLTNASTWQEGQPLWYDERNHEFRGSIVHLKSGENYQIKLQPNHGPSSAIISASTWAEEFPVVDTVFLPESSSQPLVINRSGTENGYILYTHAPGKQAEINVKKQFPLCIDVQDSVSHVILRGLTLKGAQQHGIRLRNWVNDIVIENNDISGWGTEAADGWGINRQSAIFSSKKDPEIERIIIQYNKLHHPSTNANSWQEQRVNGSFHPAGPQAIHLAETAGNHVIRNNDIYSDSLHYFNDGIGAAENFSFRGFPNCDTDIYNNTIKHCWDDGIESEGANKNVRIWGNYIDSTYVKIAIAATAAGPLYIWRNIANTSRKGPFTSSTGEIERGPFIKAGGRSINGIFYGAGKTYVYHNTVLQDSLPNGDLTTGSGSAIQASGGYLYNVVSRNNIFLHFKPWQAAFLERADSCTNDFDFDLYNGKLVDSCSFDGHESHGIQLLPTENVLFDTLNTFPDFSPAIHSRAIDAGVILPNFNDNFIGKGPDLGAIERGHPETIRGQKGLLKGGLFSVNNLIILLLLGITTLVLLLVIRKKMSRHK